MRDIYFGLSLYGVIACMSYIQRIEKVGLMSKKKKVDGWGFSRPGRAALRDFERAKPERNPEEQPCQPKENSVLPTL